LQDFESLYPSAELERLWKLVLLNQFHDIIPGSSISEVYADSAAHYEAIIASSVRLRQQAIDALLKALPEQVYHDLPQPSERVIAVNTLSHARTEVVELPIDVPSAQKSTDGQSLGIVSAPPMGFAVLDLTDLQDLSGLSPVSVSQSTERITLENQFV